MFSKSHFDTRLKKKYAQILFPPAFSVKSQGSRKRKNQKNFGMETTIKGIFF